MTLSKYNGYCYLACLAFAPARAILKRKRQQPKRLNDPQFGGPEIPTGVALSHEIARGHAQDVGHRIQVFQLQAVPAFLDRVDPAALIVVVSCASSSAIS